MPVLKQLIVALLILMLIVPLGALASSDSGSDSSSDSSNDSSSSSDSSNDSSSSSDSSNDSSSSSDSSNDSSSSSDTSHDSSSSSDSSRDTSSSSDSSRDTSPKDGSGTSSSVSTSEQERLLEQERQQLETEIEQHISDRSQELAQERSGLSGSIQEVRQDQDRVVVAADAFSYASEQGGLSSDSSAIASALSQSVLATSQAEEQIRSRSQITRFFVGGDDNAARQIESTVEANQAKIQQLQGTIDSCNCTNTTKDLLRQQLSVMQQEQDRLHTLAQQELQDQGIIGWIWK